MSSYGVTTYPDYRNAPDGGASVRDVEALFEYRGLVLNDRLTPDKYRITQFDGFDEADIRDQREPRPQQHGEFPYDAYYAGKTGVITGRIETGNYQMLHQMEQDLRSAFGPLVEHPLKARFWDVLDGFDDPRALEYYSFARGSTQSLAVSKGKLFATIGSPSLLLRSAEQRLYQDSSITVKFYQPAVTSDANGVVLRFGSSSYLLVAYHDGAGPYLYYVNGNTTYALESSGSTTPISPLQSFWLRGYAIGNELIGEVWAQDPFLTTTPASAMLAQQKTLLYGSLADSIGDGETGQSGVLFQARTSAAWADNLRIEAIYPGDLYLMCRKIDKVSIKHVQQSKINYFRDFQISLRASDPRWLSSVEMQASVTPFQKIAAVSDNSELFGGTGNYGGTGVFGQGIGGGGVVNIVSPGDQSGNVGTSISLQVYASVSDGGTFTFAATGLPDGLSISPSGLVTGTPTTSSSYSVVVTVTDSTGPSASVLFMWTISAAAVSTFGGSGDFGSGGNFGS